VADAAHYFFKPASDIQSAKEVHLAGNISTSKMVMRCLPSMSSVFYSGMLQPGRAGSILLLAGHLWKWATRSVFRLARRSPKAKQLCVTSWHPFAHSPANSVPPRTAAASSR